MEAVTRKLLNPGSRLPNECTSREWPPSPWPATVGAKMRLGGWLASMVLPKTEPSGRTHAPFSWVESKPFGQTTSESRPSKVIWGAARQAEVVGVSDAVLDELFAANTIILATGFINFNISSTLKSWVDHVARSGKTFAYGENGPAGLVTGKKVYIVLASGGIYSEGAAVQMDHAIPYLRSVLGFIGMTDVEVIRIEGVGIGPDAVTAALAKATAKVDALVAASVQTAIAA